MKFTFAIIGCFTAGVAVGALNLGGYDISNSDLATYILYALIFAVGFSIGHNPDVINGFRKLNPALALLPVFTVLGTFAASILLALVLPGRSVPDLLAVGSGFAYYSLSSIIITEYKGAELGTVALMTNLFREFLTIVAAPLLVRFFGTMAPIAAGGATTADVTLPAIIKASGEQYAPLAIYHGFIVDFSVPFLVTFFCSL